MPKGASLKYLAKAALLISRTLADASSELKAERIRRICMLFSPICVNAKMKKNNPPRMATGIAILNDLDMIT